MLLAVDAGNTNIVFALVASDDILHRRRLNTEKALEAKAIEGFLSTFFDECGMAPAAVTGAILSSVVPDVNVPLKGAVSNVCGGLDVMVVGGTGVDVGIDIDVDDPAEVGADRLVNALAAQQNHDVPLVVVDFGTATTFDVVDDKGAYAGGVIAPGIRLSLKALYDAAAQLPLIEPAEPEGGVIGKNTEDAMRSGLFWGYVGMIEGVVARLQKELNHDVRVIATGGLSPMFRNKTAVIDSIDPDLTIKGLALIYRRNAR